MAIRTPQPLRLLRRSALLTGSAVLAGGCLIACGSSGSTASQVSSTGQTTPSAAAQSGSAGRNGSGAGGGQAFRPAAQGLIAEIDSGSMQVQSESNQTTVDWTSGTTFTQTKSVPLSAVKAGVCVEAVAEQPASGTAGTGGTGGTAGTARPQEKVTALTAATVLISAPVDGKCTAGGGFPAGGLGGQNGRGAGSTGGQNGGNGQMPTGRPDGAAPTGAVRSGARGFGFGFAERIGGTVSSVSGNTITVKATERGDGGNYDATVTVNSSTKYQQDAKVGSTAVKTGLCALVMGKADDTGTVAATSVSLSDAVDGSCTSGFGGGQFRQGGQGRRPGATSSPTTTG